MPKAEQPSLQYAEGQIWEYRTRPGDEGSLLKIQKIEDSADHSSSGPVYHISIIGVHFRGLSADRLNHAPVSKHTLDASVIRMSNSKAQFPNPSEGIEAWRAAHGGVFTIPVADVVSTIDTIQHQTPQQH